eukprot:GHVU01198612.1.p2 GENE.GHVU01198612.1~~GHVU01198612.1.p2  ORF type:complete len:141 (+),score=5.39 GHVU01198612.1:369-791(+)
MKTHTDDRSSRASSSLSEERRTASATNGSANVQPLAALAATKVPPLSIHTGDYQYRLLVFLAGFEKLEAEEESNLERGRSSDTKSGKLGQTRSSFTTSKRTRRPGAQLLGAHCEQVAGLAAKQPSNCRKPRVASQLILLW